MSSEIQYSYSDDDINNKSYKIECGECGRKTNHTVVKSYRESWNFPGDDLYGVNDYAIIKCNGCDMVHFSKISSSSDDVEPIYDENGEVGMMHPDRFLTYPSISLKIERKLNYRNTPKTVQVIYNETYIALESSLSRLSTIGIRAVLEQICVSEGVVERIDLKKKIDKLFKKGVINCDMKNLLQKVRIFGNSGAHESRSVSESDLSNAWSSINSLVRYIYGTRDQKEHFIQNL